jgi:NhaP-type Na+/H+ or K+/H+ antiporter
VIHKPQVTTWGNRDGGQIFSRHGLLRGDPILSLPAVPERTTIVIMTYMVVVFSIGIQGMTLGRLVGKINPEVPGHADGVRP